jgi:single-stranded-DNA-specific exonuclease
MARLSSMHLQTDPRERAFSRTLGVPDLLARVLLARGLDDPGRARAFIAPDLAALPDPFQFTQMTAAVDRIRRALHAREPILIHGDYDVDGISATVLLLELFRLMQAEVAAHIPDRKDGYSFSKASLEAIQRGGFRLCISVDNGTNACEYVGKIQAAGCDVIVTDHHGTSDHVAPAFAILNPRLPDAGYPDRELAGVGVAFRLACAVAQSFTRQRTVSREFEEFLLNALSYVALGTVADVAPLRGENRVLVYHGLRALAADKSPGIRALLDTAGFRERTPDVEDIAYRIAPLLNAAGRVGHARDAIALLTAPGGKEASDAAKLLDQLNQERRRIERQLYDELIETARRSDDAVLVLGGDGWHPGVLGIVATRVAETLRKSAILVSFDGGRGRGSGRSADGLNLQEALRHCASSMIAHGGHAAAVGLEIERERLNELRARVNDYVAALPKSATNGHQLDGPVTLSELDPRTVRRLDQLGPFGVGNQRPRFLCCDLRLVGQPVAEPRYGDLRLRLSQSGTLLQARLRGGATRLEEVKALRDPVTVLCTPRCAPGEEGGVELVVHEIEGSAAAG